MPLTFQQLCELANRVATSYKLPADVARLTGLSEKRAEEILREAQPKCYSQPTTTAENATNP
jgi:hypothetical protein